MYRNSIADEEELAIHLTSILRGEKQNATVSSKDGEYDIEAYPKVTERLKALELLGKRYNMFSADTVVNIDPIIIRGEDELDE